VRLGPADQLDVQIYTHVLRDRIEWDLSSALPPALFAAHYARDLGLSGEAAPLIAHAITDELLRHKKDALDLRLFKESHPSEQAKWEKTPGQPRVNHRGARELEGVWRDWWEREEFSPVLIELGFDEMERRELDRVREARRAMRTLTKRRR
jgi:chromatin structure-remodeling complex subunit SFH1